MVSGVLPAILVTLAVLAWCLRRVGLPRPLVLAEKLVLRSAGKEELRAFGKRLEALGISLAPEILAAAGLVAGALPVIMGVLLILEGQRAGLFLFLSLPLILRLPGLLLWLLEKRRKEEILRDFPLLVDQVKIYAKAAGYYQALRIVSRSFAKGALGRELVLLSAEMELVGLVEAVKNFASRCGLPEIDDFSRIIAVEQTTGAEISQILANYSNTARQRQISKIKRRIKIQPILMSILPGLLLIIFMLLLILPMVGSIVDQLSSIRK